MIKQSLTVLVAAAALAVAGLPAVAQQDPQQPPYQNQQPQDAPQEMQPQQGGQPPQQVGPGNQQEAEDQGGPAPSGQQQGGPPSYAQQQGGAPGAQQQGGPPSYAQQDGPPNAQQQGEPQPGAPGMKRHGKNKLRVALRSLDLSDDQKSQIKGYMEQFRSSHQNGGTPETRRQLMANIESTLTPDQRSQFHDAMRAPAQELPQQGPAPQ